MMIRYFGLAGLILLSSCAVGPNYKRPPLLLPKTYTKAQISKTVATPIRLGNAQYYKLNQDITAQWWELFHSKPLNDLVAASLQCNPNVTAAQAALRASFENVKAQRGAFFPFIGLSAAPSYQQTASLLQSNLADNSYLYPLYTGQLFISYTADVFGGIRRQVESATAQAEFQRFQLEATYLTLTANVVNAAIQEASLREQILATQQIIANQKKIVAIYKNQLQFGDAALADVTLQEAALAAAEATLPPLEKALALQRDLLNTLAGRFPDDKQTPKFTLNSLKLPRELPLSLPSTLLEHRPDIRAAEAQMHAANALIGVAIANRLPNISLGLTNTGTAATSLAALFSSDANFWAVAGIVTHPVFAGGMLLHNQRNAEANYEQAAALYRATIINAFQNVADTLKAIRIDAITLKAANNATKAALTSLKISRQQLTFGDGSAMTILINEQAYQQARLNLIQAQALRLSDTVALFQALGGGWWNPRA